MYTIKQASLRSGLSIPTIRVWERRYGVVRPTRTRAGYRLYDDTAIARLVAMRHLVEQEGWRPSQAAERVTAAGTDLALLLRTVASPSDGAASGDSASLQVAEPSPDTLVSTARRLDVPAMERVLDDAFAARRFERAMDEVVFPSLRAVGDAWAADDLDVAQEHVVSDTVRRRLSRFFDSTSRPGRAPQVLVGLPPASLHEFGALSFAVAARRVGLDVLYLGANVPLESWLRTARETAADVVVLGVVRPADVTAARVVVEALRTLDRPPVCALGGQAAVGIAEAPGIVRLPPGTDAAVAVVQQVVAMADGRAS